MTYNTIVFLPLCHNFDRIGISNTSSVKKNNVRDNLSVSWASELYEFGLETVKHARTYAPPSLSEVPISAKCYPKPIFPEYLNDELEFANIQKKLDINKECKNHLLKNVISKLNLKNFKILVPGHGSPLGIGAGESELSNIPPGDFADQVYKLLRENIHKIETLAIRFLTCNSGTPHSGTELQIYEKALQTTYLQRRLKISIKHEKGEILRGEEIDNQINYIRGKIKDFFLSSFAGNFAQRLIQKIQDDEINADQISRIRISVSGIVGFYQHFTKDRVLVLNAPVNGNMKTSMENALVTFTKTEGFFKVAQFS